MLSHTNFFKSLTVESITSSLQCITDTPRAIISVIALQPVTLHYRVKLRLGTLYQLRICCIPALFSKYDDYD